MSTLIEIRDLFVKRGRQDALQIDELDIARGEVLAVVGPNGAGKSTLLLTLARLLKPLSGRVVFDGRPLSSWDDLEYRRKISVVLQEPLLTYGSVFDNAALGLRFRSVPKKEITERVDRWLKQLKIDHLASRAAGQLSGGEAQRVSLARAFILEPELLLLDEPFSSLDPPTRGQLLEDLSRLLAEDHRSAVFVTHNLEEANQLGHRMAVIVDGALRQVDLLKRIRSRPADESVAAFLRGIAR